MELKITTNIEPKSLSITLWDNNNNVVYTWRRRMCHENEPYTSCSIGENRKFEDVLLEFGIDDEDLISALDSLEDGADEVMQALFYLTH